MTDSPFNVVIGGEAGRGLVTLGYLLAKSLVRSGYSIVVSQNYESRIRGGHNTFAIRVSADDVAAPTEPIDLLVALDAETMAVDRKDLSSEGFAVVDEVLDITDDGCLRIPYEKLAKAEFSNVAALGVIGFILGLDDQLISKTVDEFFGAKRAEIVRGNRQALTNAYSWCAKQPSFPCQKLAAVSTPSRRLLMNGNEAIALGAMSAGVKFCSFYPMSPSTSIALSLINHSKRMNLIVEQAEDEIAAINMAIGASFAGAPSMVTTSGGGFALMEEAVSLTGVSETPLVIVVVQRPGPATGLPTRTEQADLEMVLHAGHGEFPRVIFAPGTVEDCFYLTRAAFSLAERYHGPVFLLSDQFLADSYRGVAPFDIEHLPPVRGGHDTLVSDAIYKRYAITDSGVSPRLFPGMTEHIVVADSHEHSEDGHITEDPSVRKNMVEKRLRKLNGIRRDVVAPNFEGDQDPDLLLISWGSSKGAVSEAASRMKLAGRRVATLHFSQVWPLIPDQFLGFLEKSREVVCVEGNATAQFARLIRRETGFHIGKRVLRYDGRPLTPGSILRDMDL
jgi:2-oxoglutarate ferredoxin oxidoreductase subunit alpha